MSITATRQALPTGTWNVDPVHSEIGFSIDYMAGTFRGTFARFAASLADGTVEGIAEVASVQVKDPMLEAHLQSPEFFDAERHPQLRFASTAIERSGSEVKLDGELTIRGHSEPIEARGNLSEPITDPYGKERFGLKLDATVDRTTFGLNWNAPLPTGEPALSNDITIHAELQFVKAEL